MLILGFQAKSNSNSPLPYLRTSLDVDHVYMVSMYHTITIPDFFFFSGGCHVTLDVVSCKVTSPSSASISSSFLSSSHQEVVEGVLL